MAVLKPRTEKFTDDLKSRIVLMKRIASISLWIAAALAISATAADQSASKVIERYRKATGGAALKRVRSTYMRGSISTPAGVTGRVSYRLSSPDRLRLDVEAGKTKWTECYNGKSAWRLDDRGLKTLLGDEVKRMRLGAILASGRLADLQRTRIVPALSTQQTIAGKTADAVDFTKDGVKIRLLFDAGTHLPVKREAETSEGQEEIFFSDYRPVDGVQEPFSVQIKRGGEDFLITVERVTHNTEIDESAFRYPQLEGSRPLPELAPLLKAITENQEKLDELREHYTCQMSETTRKLDGDGRVKDVETKLYEVTPVAGDFVERLMSVNGKDLTTSEREKEDKRVQKEVEELLKDKEKKKEKKERAKARAEKEGDRDKEKDKDKDDDDVTISDFLRVSEITSIRREMFRGHEVIAFDFEPKKGYKPKSRVENLIKKLAGTIWVDEDAKQIARLEAHLTDSFKVGGGLLASIGSSTAFAFEQEKVDGELWLPSYGEANIAVRLMLLAKFNRSLERRYSNYKKYDINSEYSLTKPKEAKPEKQ